MGFTFTRTPYKSAISGTDGKSVSVTMDQDSTLTDMLQAFEDFLKASGYPFTGSVQIVDDKLEEGGPFEYTTFNKDEDEATPNENEPTGC